MSARRAPILVHLLGAVVAGALAAYWIMKLLLQAPQAAMPAAAAPLPREPDGALAGRMFGDLNSAPLAGAINVQVSGVFAAGASSSAVISVDGKPARAVLLGQDVVPGARLVEVQPQGVTLEQDGARRQYAVPAAAIAQSSQPQALFRRDGATLTAPSLDPAVARPATPGSTTATPGFIGGHGVQSGELPPPRRGGPAAPAVSPPPEAPGANPGNG